jgi:uncharacterized protein (DUF952 family)
MPLIFKICPENLWRAAEDAGAFAGSPIDRADGFIHFSTAAQAAETAAKHFSEQADLVLVAVEAEALGDALLYEPSRGGALFPHLYGPLPLSAVRWVKPLRLGPDGRHRFPELA